MNLIEELCFEDLTISDDNYRLYSKNTKNRYYYYNEIQNIDKNKNRGSKKATVIMINPSEANEHFENKTPDNTINNLYNILKSELNEVSAFEVINIYSQIDPNPKMIYKQKVEKLNKNIIEKVLEKSEIVIPAWGIENKFNTEAQDLINDIKSLCKNKDVRVVINRYPCHFTTQCTSLGRNPAFIKYEF